MAGSLHDLWLAVLNRPASDDYFVTGGTARSALNDNLLAASGSVAIDTMAVGNLSGSAHSFFVQVNATSGISAGTIIFEGSNDNSNFTPLAYVDGAVASAAAYSGATVTVAASTSRFFQGPLTYRYFRVRISTAFTGGTVSATARLSTAPYITGAIQAKSTSATNFFTASTPTPTFSGGNSTYSGSIGNTATQVKSGAGQVYGWDFHNPNATIVYVQFFDVAVGSVTPGTTAPKFSVGIPANSKGTAQWPMGIAHGTAIVVAVSTTRAGGTAPGVTVDLNILYT